MLSLVTTWNRLLFQEGWLRKRPPRNLKGNQMTTYTYKGSVITKRSGMDMKRRAVSGYRVFTPGVSSLNFRTLKDAKAYVDAKVGA